MKVLIIGADGMLGSCVCREAIRQGYEVKAMVLPNRKLNVLDNLNIEFFEGNLLENQAIAQAIHGCDFVINVAASTQIWPRRSENIWKVNYHAVKALVAECKKQKVKRFIQIGTASSFGHGPKNKPGNEESPFNGPAYQLDYVDSKFQAQTMLLNEFHSHHFPVIIINPTFMIGPFDSGPSSGKMLMSLYKNELFGYSSGGKNFVATKDVAVAVVNALTLGNEGSCYIAGNENLSFEEFFRKANSMMHRPFQLNKIPNFLVILAGLWGSFIAKITRKQPKFNYNMAKHAIMEQCFDPSKARMELKMPVTPIEEAIQECLDWWKKTGLLPNFGEKLRWDNITRK